MTTEDKYFTRVGNTDVDVIIELADNGQPTNHKHFAADEAARFAEAIKAAAESVAEAMRARERKS